ncbi:MAG TPA: nickel-dependent lactate racemase [Bacteroidota bacterium]|nr:nickel-dependent lactate racemase [Bacteroidota bacterium]
MKIRIAFGREGMEIDVPDRNLAGVLEMGHAAPLAEPENELERQLLEPLGGPPLADLARRADTACVVVSDVTRPVPNKVLLPPVLRTLEEKGIGRENIVILVATGLHRQSTPAELGAMLGPRVCSDYRVVDHRAAVLGEQRFLGLTARKTPVYIDREYCDADLKITTGFIEPHLMAGFSGGRKLVAPGCAGEMTIKALHSPAFLEDPGCCEGSIEANPLHRELLEIAVMAGHDFIVNVSLNQDGTITGLFAGDPEEAHRRGMAFVRDAVRATIPDPADIVITTSAGYPLDLTYYQAVKGMTAALPVVRQGGMLIIAAKCEEGLGSPSFTSMATSFRTVDAFVATIMANPVVTDQWQLEECARAARKAEIVLVSPTVAERHGGALFIRTVSTVGEALEDGLRRFGPDARVAVIPKGPYTLVGIA